MVQQARKDGEGCIQYEEVYSIKLEAMALTNLIFIQGVFLLDSITEIMKMIELQPTKDIFFRSFMELDHSNMIQILSFESRFIERLLEEVITTDHYSFDHPLFYKMQHTNKKETIILTAIEIAVENNQIIALNRMIEFVVKY